MTKEVLNTIVTGSAGAVGSAITRVFRENGHRVTGLDLQGADGADGPSGTRNADDAFIPLDVRDGDAVDAAVAAARARMGGLDAVVHTAGILRTASFLDLDEADFQDHLDVNLMGAFRVCQAASKQMLKTGGRIVLITSIHGQLGVPGRAAYAASKGAIASLARVMAAELSPHKIRVNVLAPGAVDGGMQADPASRNNWIAATPSGRVALLDEVANLAMVLASDTASFVNGQVIAVDGGASTIRPF